MYFLCNWTLPIILLAFLPGVLEYYHASLEPIMQYPYLRTDVFQGFREIGNAILFCLQLEGFLVSYYGQSLTDVSVKLLTNSMLDQLVAFKIHQSLCKISELFWPRAKSPLLRSPPKRSHVQIFFKFATQKGNDLLLPKMQKINGGSPTSFWREHSRKNTLNLKTSGFFGA